MARTIEQPVPDKPLYPLPQYINKHRHEITNFGLFFQKYAFYDVYDAKLKTHSDWNNRQSGHNTEHNTWDLVAAQHKHFQDKVHKEPTVDDALRRKRCRQDQYVSTRSEICGPESVLSIRAVLAARLITGIGETSPTEVGMLFDRNSGLPYISAASIKGAVRYAYSVNYARNHAENGTTLDQNNVDGLVGLFGSMDTKESSRGGVVFMDAYPREIPEIVTDIMNPHFGGYYEGKNPPWETDSPTPIKFLAVEKGCIFCFQCFFTNLDQIRYRGALFAAFETALSEMGLGAKTACGYGRFKFQSAEEASTSRYGIDSDEKALGQYDKKLSGIERITDHSQRELAEEIYVQLRQWSVRRVQRMRKKKNPDIAKRDHLCRLLGIEDADAGN